MIDATARRVLTGLAVLIGLSMLAQQAVAGLGLGEARVQSYLGQPLDVSISLLQPSPAALDSLDVEIASLEDHARLGVPSDALALGLRVELDRSVDPPVIRIRSTRPAGDPFIQLLVNARWSSGRLLREYTLFLDPPTVPVAPPVRRTEAPAERSVPAQAAPVVPPTPPAERAPTPAPAPAPAPPAERPPANGPPSVVGPVESGETLWSIAAAWRPDDNLTMNQVMLAIFDQNPAAFMGDNVNRLRRGAELRMPDIDTVRAMTPAEATRRIRQHNEQWEAARRGTVAVPTITDAQAPAAPPAIPEAPMPAAPETPAAVAEPPVDAPAEAAAPVSESPVLEAEPEGRLALTPPDEAALVDLEALGAEREQLETRLETLSGELRDDPMFNEAVATRLDQVRQAIDSADAGGLMVASEDLAVLEAQLRDARAARAAEAAQQALAPPDPPPLAQPIAPAPAASLAQRWMWPALGAFVAVLLLVLAMVWLARRRRDQLEETPSAPAPMAKPKPRPEDPMERLRRLAEAEDREGFGSALSKLHETISGPTDPRWLEALAMGRILIPGHPLVATATQPADSEEDDSARALMAILDSEVGEADLQLDDDDFGLGARHAQSGPAAEANGHADIARLANRLDPDERKDSDGDRLDLPDDEVAGLFTPAEPAKEPRLEAEVDEPLSLDFEFSSFGQDDGLPDAEGAEGLDELPGEPELDAASAMPPEGESAVAPEPEAVEAPDTPFEVESDQAADSVRDLEGMDPGWFSVDEDADDVEAALRDDEVMGDEEAVDSLLSDDDAEVKMDLARAYLSMDDPDSARALLEEIIADGSEAQQTMARALLDELK